MEGTKEIKFTVRMPHVGDSLPLDSVWNESGKVIGYYDSCGNLLVSGAYDAYIAKLFGLPHSVTPEKAPRIESIPGVTA